MKKLNKFGLAALIAAGAMIFGLASCDSGNKEYVAENPTTWETLGADASGDTAKWTFAEDKASIGTAEVSLEGKTIAPDVDGKSTLVGGNGLGVKYVAPTGTLKTEMGASTGRIQASNKTASLAAPENGAMLKLTTPAATNITVRAAGAGAATAARILMITDAADTPLVYKDNLSNGNIFAFHVQGAPAGEYHIYYNGSTIYEIDCSGTKVAQPGAYTSNDDLTLSDAPAVALEALIETHTFTLRDTGDVDVTASAVWYSSNPKIATVGINTNGAAEVKAVCFEGGTVTIRARVGMYWVEKDVIFKPCETFIVNGKPVEAKLVASSVEATKFDIKQADAIVAIEPTDLATYNNGKIIGLKSGEGTITLSKNGYTNAVVALKVQGELEKVDSFDFTEITEAPTSPVVGSEGVLALVKGISSQTVNFTVATTGGLIVRQSSKASDAASIDFTGDVEYTVKVTLDNQTGNATKQFVYNLAEGDNVIVSDVMSATKGVYSFTVYVTGQKLGLAGVGTGAFAIQKIEVFKEKVPNVE